MTTSDIPTEALEAAARDKIYAAAGLAMVQVFPPEDEEERYFEWHEAEHRG